MRLRLTTLLVVLLAAATVQAQAPPAPAASVSITLEADHGTASIDRPGTFQGTVTNNAAPTGSPLDDQNQASVDVRVTGMPAGWSASVMPSSFRLRPGASQQVELVVAVSADAQATRADLTVTADLVSPLEGLDPLLGPIASQRASASDTIAVTQDDSLTRDVLETLGPWIYVVLVLLVLAVLVAIAISLAARRSLVRLSSATRELAVPPGGRVVFPFTVESLAKEEDAVLLQVSAVPEGWAAFLPVPELVLDPGQQQELNLVVIAPRSVGDGARQAVLVSATSAKAPRGAANLEFVATVQSGTPLRAARRGKQGLDD